MSIFFKHYLRKSRKNLIYGSTDRAAGNGREKKCVAIAGDGNDLPGGVHARGADQRMAHLRGNQCVEILRRARALVDKGMLVGFGVGWVVKLGVTHRHV